MNKILTAIFITFLIFTSSYAEVIKNIEITGNKRISDETIKIYGNIELDKDYTNKDIDLILRELYSTEFLKILKLALKIINLKLP